MRYSDVGTPELHKRHKQGLAMLPAEQKIIQKKRRVPSRFSGAIAQEHKEIIFAETIGKYCENVLIYRGIVRFYG
jgi:hypothetical protein